MSTISRDGDVTIVELEGMFDSLNVEASRQLEAVLLEQAAAADPPHVVLDMSRTTFIGSHFIELLFRTWKRLKERQGQMALCGLTPFCGEVLEAARLHTVWPTFENQSQACAALRGD